MQSREIESYWHFISSSIERLLTCLDGFSKDQLNWRPLPNANSLYVLAIHTLANTEENILSTLCGQVVDRDREAEFIAQGSSAESVHIQWGVMREKMALHLEQLSPSELDNEHNHPRRGQLTGREVLMVVARHISEHIGHAELTRDLLQDKSKDK